MWADILYHVEFSRSEDHTRHLHWVKWEIWFSESHQVAVSRSQDHMRHLHRVWKGDVMHWITSSGFFQITGSHKTLALSVNGRSDSLYHYQWMFPDQRIIQDTCTECEWEILYIQWMFPDHSKTQDNNCTECECEIWFTVLHPVNISRSQEDTRQFHWVWMRDLILCIPSNECFQITVKHKTVALCVNMIHCITSSGYFQITGRHKTIALSMNERSDDLYTIKWKFPDHSKTQDNCIGCEWEIWFLVLHPVDVSRSQ